MADHRTSTAVAARGSSSSSSSRQVSDTVAAPDPLIAPLPGEPTPTHDVTITADPTKEYVAGGALWLTNYLQALSWAVDDITIVFGDDLYDRMARDPMIAACLNIVKSGTLNGGVNVVPAIDDKDADGYARAVEIATACDKMLDDLTPSLDEVLWNMMDALAYGNKVAEQVYDDGDVNGFAGLVLTSIKVKPRRSTAFVVDSYRNVVGLLGLIPGDSASLVGWGAIINDPETQDNLFPREKFVVLSWRMADSDPRGTSILRPAYTPWTLKVEMWTEYRKFLTQHASPVPIGFADTSSGLVYDGENNLVPAQQAMLNGLKAHHGGAALAFTKDDRVETLFNPSGGDNFLAAFGLFDAQMSVAVLNQTLAQGAQTSAHSLAATSVHEHTQDDIIAHAKMMIPKMLRNDVARPWVRYNFGDAAIPLTPRFSLGQSEPQNFADDMVALAKAGYTVQPSQFPGISRKYQLPEADPAEIEAKSHAVIAPPPPPPVMLPPGGSGDKTPDQDDKTKDGEP